MLSALDGKRIALIIRGAAKCRVLFGVGGYRCEAGEPGSLVIRLEHHERAGRIKLHLCEEQWDGQIMAGGEYGCDYCIRLDVADER